MKYKNQNASYEAYTRLERLSSAVNVKLFAIKKTQNKQQRLGK